MTTAPARAWASTPAPRADRDLPRRLYLCRTFLQAQRIKAAARAHPGGTVLVVIGHFHKPDIEAILAPDSSLTLVSPSSAVGLLSGEAVKQSTTRTHEAAILSFNLLGRQAETGPVNSPWVERVLADFELSPSGAPARAFAAEALAV